MAQRIVPMIAYADAAAAIDWLTEAFGFREREGQRYTADDGTVTHAELERNGATVISPRPTPVPGPRRPRETRGGGGKPVTPSSDIRPPLSPLTGRLPPPPPPPPLPPPGRRVTAATLVP